jgi:hypothetical protein
MAGFARKFPFSESRATIRTWSRGVGLLRLVASGVSNVVFVEEIIRQRGRYLRTTALRPNLSWPKYRRFHDPRTSWVQPPLERSSISFFTESWT